MSGGTTERARAKVNLTLHVGARISSGKWEGYHPVESLVVFADFGDVGGGTADAAAVLRVFDPKGRVSPLKLGADGPVCHLSRTAMMEGIGEVITQQPGLGQLSAVLINPGVAVSTGAIFKAMDAAPRDKVPAITSRQGDLLSRALSGENDMQEVAVAQAPIIADVLRSLAQQAGCELARMSGSGATCFGIFRSDAQAAAAAKAISAAQSSWWVRPCRLGDLPQDLSS